MNSIEVLEQIARQQSQPNKKCTIKVYVTSDESYVAAYGNTRAKVNIILPESVALEFEGKYQ